MQNYELEKIKMKNDNTWVTLEIIMMCNKCTIYALQCFVYAIASRVESLLSFLKRSSTERKREKERVYFSPKQKKNVRI